MSEILKALEDNIRKMEMEIDSLIEAAFNDAKIKNRQAYINQLINTLSIFREIARDLKLEARDRAGMIGPEYL